MLHILAGGYIALSTMLGQMVGSCVSGILENAYPRKNILIASLLLGSAASMLFGIIRYYPGLLMLRIVTGGCQGAIVPVLFSLIGDFYSVEERATYSAVVSSCLGGGMMLGQLFTGYTLGKYLLRTSVYTDDTSVEEYLTQYLSHIRTNYFKSTHANQISQ